MSGFEWPLDSHRPHSGTPVDKDHLRHCIQYEYEQGNDSETAAANLCRVFGPNTVTECICQKWFEKFKIGDYSSGDESCCGTPQFNEVHDDVVRRVLQDYPFLASTIVGEKLGLTQNIRLRNKKKSRKLAKK